MESSPASEEEEEEQDAADADEETAAEEEEEEDDDEDSASNEDPTLEDLFEDMGLSGDDAPNARHDERGLPGFIPGHVYPSSQVRRANGNRIQAVGHAFSEGGRYYKAVGTGRVYDTTQLPPGDCFNCGGRHWRQHCPYARFNSTIAY